MTFTNSSVLVLTDTNTVHSFATAQNSPVSVAIPAGSSGIWTWVVSRAGYSTQLGTFDATGGGIDSASPTPVPRLQPSGADMFTNTANPAITVSFATGPDRCFIDIGDASVSAQAVLDAVETALETQAGCQFLAATGGSEVTYAGLSAGEFLFMGTGYRFRRASAGDVNATVGAFPVSVDGTPTDGANGSVTFLSSASAIGASDIAAIADAVWDELQADHTTAGSFGVVAAEALAAYDPPTKTELDAAESAIRMDIANLPTPLTTAQVNAEVDTALAEYDAATAADLAAAQAALVAEHDATQASLAALPTPLTAAEVNAEVDQALVDYDAVVPADIAGLATSAEVAALNDISTADVATELATYDAATGAEVAAVGSAVAGLNDLSAVDVNAAVDTALADYDGPTNAELTAARNVITAAIAALNDLSAADVAGELATYDAPTKAELDTAEAAIIAAVNAAGITVADIADGVWDEVMADHLTAGTTGATLQAALTAARTSIATNFV